MPPRRKAPQPAYFNPSTDLTTLLCPLYSAYVNLPTVCYMKLNRAALDLADNTVKCSAQYPAKLHLAAQSSKLKWAPQRCTAKTGYTRCSPQGSGVEGALHRELSSTSLPPTPPLLLHHLLHPNDDRGDDEQAEDDSLVEAVIDDALVCKFTRRADAAADDCMTEVGG